MRLGDLVEELKVIGVQLQIADPLAIRVEDRQCMPPIERMMSVELGLRKRN